MEISSSKLRNSLINLKNKLKCEDKLLNDFLRLKKFSEKDVEKIYKYLNEKLLDFRYTDNIGICFRDTILLIVSSVIRIFNDIPEDFEVHQRKCIVLSKLIKYSPEILKYSTKYFAKQPAPFKIFESNVNPKKKTKLNESSFTFTDLEIVKCCYNLLSTNPNFYKYIWNWSEFLELYLKKGSKMQQLFCNHITGILTNMTEYQLKQLNSDIPEDEQIRFDEEINKRIEFLEIPIETINSDDEQIIWNFTNNVVINVEGVLLPIYNNENSTFYEKTDGNYDKIVKVESTQINLRSISLGITSGKAICLSGPVGCGKTTLVEYLARKTGRICPKTIEIESFNETDFVKKNPLEDVKNKNVKENCIKRKNEDIELSDENFISDFMSQSFDTGNQKNGFLRIQLGDQTDSKMLLGQYRCTDVPGEFIWLPGVLTQAVMNGYWLLLEDLDSATQDTFTILSNLLENNSLSVPGFRDCVKIEPGFQLFVTTRTNKSGYNSQKSLISLLEKYLYTINILPLSRNELCHIISINYPKLKTIANRIVDVYLTFSSGDHSVENLRIFQNENSNKISSENENYIALPFEKISISNLTNYGRLVSTRDLIKLCQRSNPMFSVTSTECAYFVFQNAVDVFCSYLPCGPEKTKLISSIGAKIGIIQSRCEFFANEYKPEILIENDRIKIGRSELKPKLDFELKRHQADDDLLHGSKKVKLNENTEKTLYLPQEKNTVTFSFTRMASCLLERIAVCIEQNEPILLVGETGVGKTSSVQYLAQKTNHKLIVINMNNQSDVSDLVGGFKPVDLSYVMAPLRSEFEKLFRNTFNENKNEKFLNNISICYNQGRYKVLIKLMIKIFEAVFDRARENTFTIKNSQEYLKKWRLLQTKILKLNSQLEKSINISFAFITGSLVNCIKNGNWVLLDEINLASAETLECLSTILEPDGSIVLLEKGDFVPVKRHPNFRILACMNPNTDIGKKDLPVGIRNRFTEFFVDELTTENDLMLLVNDYLNNTGIKKTKVLNIVKLYKKLKLLSNLELNDGLGNRPVFSLRTLCRSLMICGKNLCGSIERNLYESFCLSFLTQLDSLSHKIVLNLIKEAMLSNAKAILSQGIPQPGENFIDFEGYWIEKGLKEINDCENYILTDSVKQNLKDLSRIISIGKLPILLQGPTSAGKTSLIEYVAKKSGNHCLRINNHEHTDLQEYIGTYTSDVSGKLTFKEGVLVQAMRNGFWIILDELNLASTDILEALNRVLDDNRELFIPETQTVVKAHKNFMLFATQNPPGLYGGRKTLSRAFKNRFIELHFSEIPKPELEIILEKRCLIPKSYSQKMVKCMAELQANRKTTTKNNFTLRDLFRWGNRYTYADKKLLDDNSYDWNQHLVDEGYLVLSAKVRTDIEVEIIEEALYKNFRKKINTENLYSLSGSVSMVTKDILESLHNYKNRSDIVWTHNMTRMAILTAKALQFNEPVLLVGPTGCGKTTICQILANIKGKKLRILNCHMHTEGADFLGGLRPCRTIEENVNSKNGNSKKQLFEWADGPLVMSMQEGSFFMADEISLAEDSVLERLNSILEPERTVLLAEKGGVSSNVNAETLTKITKDFIIQAHKDFNFFATMNPGGDFGKKELSPALRNRFTEIWCKPSDDKKDLIAIAENCLRSSDIDESSVKLRLIASVIINIVFYLKEKIEKFKFSVRDILAFANYLLQNSKNTNLVLSETIIFGLETIFLDSLEMLPHESIENITNFRNDIIKFSITQMQNILGVSVNETELQNKRGNCVEYIKNVFGIKPFYIETNTEIEISQNQNFLFEAPTTKNNLFRLLSALSLKKAILLEGPPGVGKTSIVESLAQAIGYKIVRINLCEHTDLADLFGTDLPAEEKSLELNVKANFNDELNSQNEQTNLGSFVWRDGPLLAALKSENTWILLDELNLAPQSVLEGLNAILDHRGEVFIPELNKVFSLGQQTRIFACQNPLRQGGGRKGLPQSFLNRFTKVYLRKLNTNDLLYVVNGRYSKQFEQIKEHFKQYFNYIEIINNSSDDVNLFEVINQIDQFTVGTDQQKYDIIFNIAERMVKFSEILDQAITNLEFGYKGGPFEINLRDILRWCDLLINEKTGFIIKKSYLQNDKIVDNLCKDYNNFLLILYERMKLVYCQRMRSEQDRNFIRNSFGATFNCDANKLNTLSEDIAFYWTDTAIYLNDIVLERNPTEDMYKNENYLRSFKNVNTSPLLLVSQRELLKNLTECVHMEKPVILCGPTDSGKTKAINILCTISNQICNLDTIDDSVTGSFQQIDLNRHLEEISQNVESILISTLHQLLLNQQNEISKIVELFNSWNSYTNLIKLKSDNQNSTAMSDELILFRKRIEYLNDVIETLLHIKSNNDNLKTRNILEALKNIVLQGLKNVIKNSDSLNTGGHFEWVDSKIVTSLKSGQYICLEHVNLCSSAVLDRLNPVFEPNGNLLISEKGVTAGNEAELVEKHENFRAFLTLDPKNGELSRAMRNRCIELALTKDVYTKDDLKMIIYINGIHKMYLINTILRIHEEIKNVTDMNNFNISHLTRFAFLVSSYKRIGYSDEKAIYFSGLEVYVYSSNTDLLGYGLPFYQNKLKNIIKENSKIISNISAEIYNYKNIIISCDNLNSMSLVKLQCEPLVILLNNLNETEMAKENIGNLFENLKYLQFDNDFEFIKYYLYLIYESSTFEDVSYRYKHLTELLNNSIKLIDHEKNVLIQLNHNLFNDIKKYKTLFKKYAANLPWNTKLFPRIRQYQHNHDINSDIEFQLSALLLSDVLIKTIADEKVYKLSKMSPISYSQAINTKSIGDSANNILLQYISPFLNSLQLTIRSTLTSSSNFDIKKYIELIISYLWFNRLYICSKSNNLFIDKTLNTDLMDKLLLHFKWIDKNLLKNLEYLLPNYKQLNNDYDLSLQKIRNYSMSISHPLNLMRKFYFKKNINFDPYYSEQQVRFHELKNIFESLINLVPHFGSFENKKILNKYLYILSDSAAKFKSIMMYSNLSVDGLLKKIRKISGITITEPPNCISENMKNAIKDFQKKQLNNEIEEIQIDFKVMEEILSGNDVFDNNELKILPNFIEIEILSLREYFLLKYLSQSNCNSISCYNLNTEYYENISSLKCNDLELIQIINSEEFKNFNKMWITFMNYIVNLENLNQFEELLKCFTNLEYRNFTTFYRNIMKSIQMYQLSSLANRQDCCLELSFRKDDINSEMQYNGPPLTNIILSMLFKADGKLRSIALSDLNMWKKSLNNIRQLLWNNSNFISTKYNVTKTNLNVALLYSQKLVYEIEHIQKLCQNMENENFSDYNENFGKLVNKLKVIRKEAENNLNNNCNNDRIYSALLHSVIGSIELCVLTFTPLIDPVEKNDLKNKYIIEDINCLRTLTNIYDFMKIIMKYKNFGSEIYDELEEKISQLEKKNEKYSQKVALRSENCLYGNLVQDINHFLNTNCKPQSLLSLILKIEELLIENMKPNSISSYLLDISECIKMIEVWIANSKRFIHHTLKKYSNFYRDFLEPLECSVIMTRFGFEELKSSLIQLQNSFVTNESGLYGNLNVNNNLMNVLENIIQFPSTTNLKLFENGKVKKLLKSKSSIFTILDKAGNSEKLYFALLKGKIMELKNRAIISSYIDNMIFYELDTVLNISNQIWQEEEERRRKRIAEEESLYVNKTRCKEENEEEMELLEIHDNFPTYVEQDFGEFVVEDSLEKIIKLSNVTDKKIINVIENDDFKLLGETFVFIMEHFARNYYYRPDPIKSQTEILDFVTPFKDRIEVFVKLFNHYKPGMNELIDEKIYNSFGFAVGLQQNLLNEISINNNSGKVYNFYKDSNIPEIISCSEILNEIEIRVQEQINLYPEHATLNDIIRVIIKIRSLPAISSVVRFNTGFQILRQKLSLWNEVAHKNNHMRDLETRVAEYVQHWTKLELQFWRNCLSQTNEKVESIAYKYWFFIYNLLHEYLEANQVDSSLADFKNTEKRFEEGTFENDNEGKTFEIHSADIIRVLTQFIESSNYGDFEIRMKLLKTFELYLNYIPHINEIRKEILIAILHNLQIYYYQFSMEIDETKKSIRTPIEKKLREFVKIESYNKDLSYFSMRNNVSRVHRTLNKFLKEYELQLKNKITSVFQHKNDNLSKELNLDNEKGGKNLRHETKIKYYMIDVKNFLASVKLKNQFILATDENFNTDNLILINKLDKLFITSRNVCKQAILHAEYPSMIYSLDLLLTDQIETCEYLKNLEVDRSQERPKQIIHAKNILQQKRKSLSDLFKTLSTLGINYKTGLMELSLNLELTDFKIEPFCIKKMISDIKYKKLDQNLIYLSENLDTYFAKCVFKLKLLKNAMLTPQSELGPPNIDRIKGFSIDMFLLIQNQRKLLSKSITEIYDLRNIVSDITNLFHCVQTNNFSNNKMNFSLLEDQFISLQESFIKIQYVFEQFKLLLKCIPDTENSSFRTLENNDFVLFQNSDKYFHVIEICNEILEISKRSSKELLKFKKMKFLNYTKIYEFLEIKENITLEIFQLRKLFELNDNEYLPIGKSLTELLNYLDNIKVNKQRFEENDDLINIDNIDIELENIVHSILLAMQKLYKKYSQKETSKSDDKTESPNKKHETIEEQSILDNHLKQKLFKELTLDMETLNIKNILEKLSNIILSIKYTENLENKNNYICKIVGILPILEQFSLISDYYIFQQLGANKVSSKMLSIMLTVFIELLTKGFCVPADLMQDEEGDAKKEEQKGGEGFGLEDGTGEKDASDKIEDEDQLDDAKKPEDRKKESDEKNENCKEEKGIDMSEDFDANLQDIEKPDNDSDEDNEKSDNEDELDKEMGDTEQGAEKLDDQIWGSDEEKEESENEDEMSEEEEGKGNKDEDDQHNKLDTKNETQKKDDGENDKDGLDATDDQKSEKEKNKQEKDIDDMKEPEIDDDQINPYHNELEEPPEAEDMDLGDNVNLDEENAKDNDNEDGENPFDIDAMKENMDIPENDEETEDNNGDKDEENKEVNDSDSESEPEAGTKPDDEDEIKEKVADEEDENKEKSGDESEEKLEESEEQTRGEIDPESPENNEDENSEAKQHEEKIEKFEESKDKASKEENIQSVPDEKHQGSNDEVQNEEKDAQQEQNMDAQDTGEDKDGIGIAENDTADRGHQGIADTKETKANEDRTENEKKNKKKQGKTNEERTLGDPDKNKLKQLKTIEKLKEQMQNNEDEKLEENDDKNIDAEEYQHVKEATKTDSTTMDNATEEQSKQIQHLEDENKKNEEEENENNDNLMETDNDENIEENLEEISDMKAEKNDQKSEIPSKSEKSKEKCETLEKMEIEGDLVETMKVQRGDATTAHCIKDILLDTSISEELTTAETLELRKMYQNELLKNKILRPDHEIYEFWQTISNKMLSNARELCEQLRLILEPTKCTRLKGDYRTGRRINMKKIIPYIASQFRKDKIWLRRTKPAQRDYKITIAIDDSKSMHHNNSKNLTLEAISLVSQALTLLESGKLSILSFGETPQIILNHTEQFDGPKLVNSLNFDQNQSRIAELLDFIRTSNMEEGSSSSDNGIFENLLLVLSDGRNIYSEGEQKVKNAIKLARLQRIFLVYIIIDNPENKHSILDIRVPNFSSDRKSISMKSYLDMFPFPYYVIVRDLGQLPIVLSEAMRQWFELVNSEQ